MRSDSVFFRGIDQVVDAYRNNDIPSWAICASPKSPPMFRHVTDDIEEGAEVLQQALMKIMKNGSTAPLCLKVYEDIKPPDGKIKSNTPFDCCISFNLYDYNFEADPRFKHMQDLKDRIAALEQEKSALSMEADKPVGVIGKLMGMLERPEFQDMIMQGVVGWIKNKFSPLFPAKVGSINMNEQPTGSAWDTLAPDQQSKLTQAMEMLMRVDPLIGDHLLKLATKAAADTGWYSTILKFL